MNCLVFFTTFAVLTAFASCLPLDKDETAIEEVGNSIDYGEDDTDLTTDYIDLSQYGSSLFGLPDDQVTGKAVAEYTADSNMNPEELGTYVEGDILIPRQEATRNGLTTLSSRWPKGIVPFEIRGNFNAREMGLIEQAINDFHKNTCIRFVPRRSESDYVSIVGGNSGCWSSVGRIGGKQEVNLQAPGCLTKAGTAVHELMHAVGFLHEQNRYERDDYVTIRFENIQSSAVSNFDKVSADSATAFGVPYDYGSVMHYSGNAFSSNGRPTIVPKQTGAQMGQRDGFSAFDVEKLNAMYQCNARPPPAVGGPGPVAPAVRPPVGGGAVPVGRPQRPPANVLTSFLGGLIHGLGLAEEPTIDSRKE